MNTKEKKTGIRLRSKAQLLLYAFCIGGGVPVLALSLNQIQRMQSELQGCNDNSTQLAEIVGICQREGEYDVIVNPEDIRTYRGEPEIVEKDGFTLVFVLEDGKKQGYFLFDRRCIKVPMLNDSKNTVYVSSDASGNANDLRYRVYETGEEIIITFDVQQETVTEGIFTGTVPSNRSPRS